MSRKDTLRRIDQGITPGGAAVSIVLGGSGGGVSNADTVDGYHASSTRTAGKLLALDAAARFAPAVIDWASVAGAGLGASGNTLVVQWGATPTTIVPDASAYGGSAATSARVDHIHAIAAAVAGSIVPDATAAEGTSTSFARADHVHGIVAAIAGSIQPDDTAAEGTATSFARADHRHAIAAAAPSANLTYITNNDEGGSTAFARADHSHRITAYADASVYQQHLLKSDASGDLKVHKLTATDRLRTSLVDSETGTNLRLAPAQDLDLQPGGTARVRALSGVRLQSDNYTSQTTGWATAYSGAADFRYVYTDELHAKAFVADLEQALAGGQIISKSVAPLSRDFTAPAAGAAGDLWVECFQGFPGAQVFAANDVVMVRSFDRSGGGLSITNCFGTVSAPYIPDPQNDPPEQRWTFTRLSGTVGGHPAAGYMAESAVVKRGSLALDFGVSGNGYYEVNAIDGLMGQNSPYAQNVKWTAHPWYDRTVTTRMGNLKGIFNVADEYGLYAGTGVTDADQFLRLSNNAIEGHNLPVKLYDGSNTAIVLQPAASPYMAMGVPIPTGWLTQSGWWAGKSGGTYRQYLGTVSGGDIAAGIKWDGTTLTVRGQIYVTGGDAAKTDLNNVAANTVTGKVNAASTLIQPGRIQVYSTATLEDWRYGNTTTIDGGAIAADTVTASALLVHGTNWINNPGFETGTAIGWVTGAAYLNIGTGGGHSGDCRLRGQGDGANIVYPARTASTRVEAGRNYYAGVWVLNGAGTGAAGLHIQWLDATGTPITTSNAYTAASTSWALKSVVAAAPSNAYWMRLWLVIGADNSSVVAFDDVEFYEADGRVLVGVPSGARVEINNSGIEGYSDATTKQFYLRTSDGRGMFGGGKGVLDASGLALSGNETSYRTYNAVRWLAQVDPPADPEVARVAAGRWGGLSNFWELTMETNPGLVAGYASDILVRANTKSASDAGSNYIRAGLGLYGEITKATAILSTEIDPGEGYAAIQVVGTATDSYIKLMTHDTERMRITATGSVGIGINAPLAKLHLSSAASQPGLLIDRTTGYPSIKAGAADGYMLIESSGQLLGLNWSSSDRVVLCAGGGNVAVGANISPAQKLEVQGVTRSAGLCTDLDANDNGAYVWGLGGVTTTDDVGASRLVGVRINDTWYQLLAKTA